MKKDGSHISNVGNKDWEKEPFSYIRYDFVGERKSNFFELVPDILRLCRLFQDLADGVQWYTYLHKSKIDFSNQSFPRNEWSHFSNSLIQEQDKKMKYCFEVSKVLVEMQEGISESEMREFVIYLDFYNHLVSTGTLSDR